jgi:hypothetical protein
MWNRWAALALVLALAAFTPKYAAGQAASQGKPPGGGKAGSLGQNYPNPFNPETTLPFSIGDDACSDGGKNHVVSITFYNVLTQPVAIPILQGGGSASAGRSVDKLTLTCGKYTAFWNGKVMNSGREAASGIYTAILVIDGRVAATIRMFIAK